MFKGAMNRFNTAFSGQMGRGINAMGNRLAPKFARQGASGMAMGAKLMSSRTPAYALGGALAFGGMKAAHSSRERLQNHRYTSGALAGGLSVAAAGAAYSSTFLRQNMASHFANTATRLSRLVR